MRLTPGPIRIILSRSEERRLWVGVQVAWRLVALEDEMLASCVRAHCVYVLRLAWNRTWWSTCCMCNAE